MKAFQIFHHPLICIRAKARRWELKMRIGFIGLGNMASAMICGMRREGLAEGEDILGSAKTQATRDRARKEWGIRTTEKKAWS